MLCITGNEDQQFMDDIAKAIANFHARYHATCSCRERDFGRPHNHLPAVGAVSATLTIHATDEHGHLEIFGDAHIFAELPTLR